MIMIRRIFAMLFSTMILSGLVMSLTATSAEALGWRRYKSVDSTDLITMCKDWVDPNTNLNGCSTDSADRRSIFNQDGYRCTYPKGSSGLSGCYNNQIVWSDTDGFYVGPGWEIATNIYNYPDRWTHWERVGWRKHRDCYCWTAIKKFPRT